MRRMAVFAELCGLISFTKKMGEASHGMETCMLVDDKNDKTLCPSLILKHFHILLFTSQEVLPVGYAFSGLSFRGNTA